MSTRLLVHAATRRGPTAVAAWREWRTEVDLDDVDDEAYALLPALARRPELFQDDPDRGRLRGIYRRSWVAGTLLLEQARPALAALERAGISVALVGPAAMVPYLDGDVGARPFDVVDVLLGPTPPGLAQGLLARLGWVVGDVLQHPGGGRLRLRPRAVATSVGRWADAALWSSARPAGDRPGKVLDRADLLLLLLLDDADDAAWTVDVHHLLQVADLHRLEDRASSHGVVRRCRERLAVVAGRTGGAVPGLERLGPLDRARGLTLPPGRAGRAAALLLRHAGGQGLRRAPSSVLDSRLDLSRAARPAVTVLSAATGRPGALERLAASSAAPRRVLAAGDLLDLADPSSWRSTPARAGATSPPRGHGPGAAQPVSCSGSPRRRSWS